MKNKRRNFFWLVSLVPTLFSIFTNIGDVIQYETSMVKQTIKKLFIIRLLLTPLLTATWISLLGILYLAMVSWQWGTILSLFIIFLLNVIILIIFGIIFLRAKRNITFPETRSMIRHLLRFK